MAEFKDRRGERVTAAPRSLDTRYPMLFDPQYDAPEGHGPVGKEEEVTSQTFWPNGRCEGCGNGLNDHGQCQSEDCSENPHFEEGDR